MDMSIRIQKIFPSECQVSLVNILTVERSSQESCGFSHERLRIIVGVYVDNECFSMYNIPIQVLV